MIAQRRGKNVALVGTVGQLLFTGVMIVVWRMTGSAAAASCVLLLAGGVPLWLMVALISYCRQLQRQESWELEELAAQGRPATAIFQEGQDQELQPAAARLKFVEKWLVPAFTLLWAGLNVGLALLMLHYVKNLQLVSTKTSGQGILLSLVVGFVAFLLSRYSTGMSKVADWRLLRATGSYLLINVLYIAAVLAGLIAAHQEKLQPDLIIAYFGPVVQLILSAELLLNFMLDLYRPRVPGREHRPSFDSRLFDLVAQPDKVGHSIADTLNYQFGFEVSRTWFYQLVSKAAFPLVVFGALVIVAMTSIVIVPEGQQCVIMHWGRLDRVLGSGMAFKWPWPIDNAKRFATGKVQRVLLGVGKGRKPVLVKKDGKFIELYLWTQEHSNWQERDFVVAAPPRLSPLVKSDEQKPPPPVNLIKLVVDVEYMIADPVKFGYRYRDSAKILKCEAYREMVKYCASATLDTAVPGGQQGRPEAIMTYGRDRVAKELKQRIQAKADNLGLGVKICFVGLRAVHPPAAAATAYEEVLQAERGRLLTRYAAEADANKTLVEVAGTPLAALRLSLSIGTLEELERLRDNPDRRDAILTDLIRQSSDDIKTLNNEIEQERLLGQIQQGAGKTDKQELRDEQLAHRTMLLKIQANPDSVDLNAAIAAARSQADALFDQTVGRPAKEIAQAEAYRTKRELTEMARAQAFASHLLAYNASPKVYMLDRWLDVWDEVLPSVTKYVMGVDHNKVEVWLNWERQADAMKMATIGQKGSQ